jgi:hypothetical protein
VHGHVISKRIFPIFHALFPSVFIDYGYRFFISSKTPVSKQSNTPIKLHKNCKLFIIVFFNRQDINAILGINWPATMSCPDDL